jgi:hypothetical protein
MDQLGQDERRGTGGRDDGATFELARLRAGGRPPVLAAVIAITVGALVIVGSLERIGAPTSVGTSFALGGSSSAPSAGAVESPRNVRIGPAPLPEPSPDPDMAPVVASAAGPIQLQARRHPETTYVHGDVFVADVTWVFLSIQDASGRVAGWASVSVPGAAGPTASNKPTLRFDVEVAVPTSFDGIPIWIQANAYDTEGRVVETTRFEILADGSGGAGAVTTWSTFNPRPPPAHGASPVPLR